MNICIFGESCVGKSTLAAAIQARTAAKIYTGKDYLRLAKSESEAKEIFRKLLAESDNIIYVTTEVEGLSFLPQSCLRILLTEDLDVIKERFARRTGGQLPPPVARMLEQKHGAFDNLPHDLHFHGGAWDINAVFCL